jgi:hypothetical protein
MLRMMMDLEESKLGLLFTFILLCYIYHVFCLDVIQFEAQDS